MASGSPTPAAAANGGNSSERTPLLANGDAEASTSQDEHPNKFRSWVAQTVAYVRRNWIAFLAGLLLFVFALTLFIYIGVMGNRDLEPGKPHKPHKPKTEYCTTPGCIHVASTYLNNLSPNYKDIDPCTDFNEYMCGGWLQQHDIPADQNSIFGGSSIVDAGMTTLRHVLESPYPESSDHSSFSPARLASNSTKADRANFIKAKDAFEACMDEGQLAKVGLEPLQALVTDVEKLYPDSPYLDFGPVLSYLFKIGVGSLISLGVGADDRDPDVVVLSVFSPQPVGLPSKQYYENEKIVAKYQTAINEMFSLFADSTTGMEMFKRTLPSQLAVQVVQFETALSKVTPDPEDESDITKYYNPMTIKETDQLVPAIFFSWLVKQLAPPQYTGNKVIVSSPAYLQSLSELITITPADTLQAYFVWKVIQRYAGYLDADLARPYLRFVNELSGKLPDASEERWKTCVNFVSSNLGWITSRFYIEKAFSESAKDLGDRIISDIKYEFVDRLKDLTWMSNATAKLAEEKVHNIDQKVGYPTKSPDIRDPGVVRDYYASLSISADEHFSNAVFSKRFNVEHEWNSLGKPVDRNEWGMFASTVNAYYNPAGNEIVFPAAIMQSPLFGVDLPEYISYGAFGSISGHELSHAFDNSGRHFDTIGNYSDWWDKKTVDAFEDRAQCFVDQYSNFTIPGLDGKPLHVNGKLTLGENIADSGGVNAAFSAWKRRADKKPNLDLPGLQKFTQEQLFFIAYGTFWCGATRPGTAVTRLYTDPHSPNQFRIMGTLENARAFKEAFQCKKKEPTCQLW